MHEIVWNFIEKRIFDNFLNFFLGLESIQVFYLLLFNLQYSTFIFIENGLFTSSKLLAYIGGNILLESL